MVALEEPEAHAFPFLVAGLAREIAHVANSRDDLYIIATTHNPVLLTELLLKTREGRVAAYLVYRDSRGFTRFRALGATSYRGCWTVGRSSSPR